MEKVISIVGAGGKTTLVHKLARKYHRSGKGVLVTTTTHMYVEADTDLSCDFFALRDKIINNGYCMAGQKISEHIRTEKSKPEGMVYSNEKLKMCGLPYDLLDKLIKDMPQALDYVIIEADGAKHHSLKYPAADEPVIYPGTTDVIIVLGTWEKGRSCKDVVFRYELMQKELGTAADAVVDDSIIDTLRQVYVRKLRDSGFEGRVSCVFANERGGLNSCKYGNNKVTG